MSDIRDKTNCIKNLMQLMCCDGRISGREKQFLALAARQVQVEIDDWDALLKEVRQDAETLYPIENRDRALASLKAMVVMAKADQRVDKEEAELIMQFAKSLGLSNREWKKILKEIDIQTLFEPFQSSSVLPVSKRVLVLKEDFDKIDRFLEVMDEYNIPFRTIEQEKFLKDSQAPEEIVCFHAAEDRQKTVDTCHMLLTHCRGRLVSILTRYQGYQVRYLLEIGLKKCIIEPVYARDVEKLFEGP